MSNYIVKKETEFDLEQTLECGQCFHFLKRADEEYVLSAYGRGLHIKQEGDELIFYNTTKEDFDLIWRHYFDLDRDYKSVKKRLLETDKELEEAIKAKWGVYILNQSFFETLISFIISQNKQIPHIKKIVWAMSEKYGNYLGEYAGVKLYAFPTPEQLRSVTEDDLKELKTGFRAAYIKDAIDKVLNLEYSNGLSNEDFMSFFSNLSNQDCLKELMKIKGVGLKVASCVSLFALGKRDAFPIDVWIKRIMIAKYFDGKETKIEDIESFAKEKYKDLGGYAQQYLFYYARDLAKTKK